MAARPKPTDAKAAAIAMGFLTARRPVAEPSAPAETDAERLKRKTLAAAEAALDMARESKDLTAAVSSSLAAMRAFGLIEAETKSDADGPPTFVVEFAEPKPLDVPAKPEAPAGQTHQLPAVAAGDEDEEPRRRRGAA